MKSKKTIVMLSALAALCLTSCDKNEEVNAYDGAVRFTAGIGQEAVATPQSRAAGAAWHNGDEIGIFMVKHSEETIVADAENKQYITANGDGNFTAAIGNQIYYPVDNSAVDFIAYYPYKDNAKLATGLKLAIATTQTDESQAATDLMWAKSDNGGKGYTKNKNASVAFTFGHCLSKLTMNCKVDPSVGASSSLDNATVAIIGMPSDYSFDLRTGKLSIGVGRMSIISRKLSDAPSGFDGAYDAIILPSAYAAGELTVEFNIGGETFTWNVDAITFESGKEYIYEVTITRTGVKATGTITPWNTEKKGPVTAE